MLVLRILAGRHVGKELRIKSSEFVIGRDEGCHMRPNSSEVSRRHCAFRIDADHRVTVADCGSTNGTYVNGRRIETSTLLATGDVLIVGPLMFEVYLPQVAAPEAAWELSEPEQVDFDTPGTADNEQLASRTYIMSKQELSETLDTSGLMTAPPPATAVADDQTAALRDAVLDLVRGRLQPSGAMTLLEVELAVEQVLQTLRHATRPADV